MPMKVSPKCFVQLGQRVNILQKKEKERYIRAQVKGTGKFCINEVQVRTTGKYTIGAQKKGQQTGNIANPGQRPCFYHFICILTSPGQ